MATEPELFVVCKHCGAEVSPYITECPYCGNRLRKRAPKLRKGRLPKVKQRISSHPTLPRLRPGEIPGIRIENSRPYVTITLVLSAVIISLLGRLGAFNVDQAVLEGAVHDEYWRFFTTIFVYEQIGYEIVVLTAIALFGWLLERRHGAWATLLVFLLGGACGSVLVWALDPGTLTIGGNGAALALLAAWAMRDILARRAGIEDDADMLGVLAFAIVLVLIPIAAPEANSMAAVGGGLAGILLGLILARLPEH